MSRINTLTLLERASIFALLILGLLLGSKVSHAAANSDVLELSVTNVSGVSNKYVYYEFSDIKYTFQAGDYIEYDVQLLNNNPGAGGIEIINTDNTNFRNAVGWQDQNAISGHPAADISSKANNVWYHRKLAVPSSMIGKTSSKWDLVGENDAGLSHYKVQYENIAVTDGSGNVRPNGNIFTTYSDYNSSLGIDISNGIASSLVSVAAKGNVVELNAVNTTGSSNKYVYHEISDKSYTFQSGDYIEYDVQILNNISGAGGIEIVNTDNTNFRNAIGWQDQNGITGHPAGDISSRAYNVWYHRKLAVPSSMIGKTSSKWDLVGENDEASLNYKAQYENIVITDGNGNVRTNGYVFTNSKDYDSSLVVDTSNVASNSITFVPKGYTFCADQNSTCSFSGSKIVAFGANGAYNYQKLISSTACTSTVLGNPKGAGLERACFTPIGEAPESAKYVSDMPWISATAGASTTVHRDQDVFGGALTIRGKAYSKGVGTHAFNTSTNAETVIDIAGQGFASFGAYVGIDDYLGISPGGILNTGGGSVQFIVLVDGVEVARSPVLTGNSAPFYLAANVAGGSLLTLSVTNGGDNYTSDWADWGDAKLYRPNGYESRDSKVVTTVNPTVDTIISDFNVLDYGADNTGVTDSTMFIQNAINECGNTGGGTVWMPSGTYKVSSTILVRPFCNLRGDRRDPDTGSGSFGTVISADVSSDIGTLFSMDQSSGANGLTVYYPNQSSTSPIDLGWAFEFRISEGQVQGPHISNITLLNAYKGIGINAPPNQASINSNIYIDHIKGTALYRGLSWYNAAGAGSLENITFSNSYWANAGATYNAPLQATLNTWTRANGIAFTFGDLEADLFYKLTASNYKYGINVVKGSWTDFWGAMMAFLDITDTDIAMKIDNSFRMSGIIRSTLSGSTYSIQNNSGGIFRITDSSLTGGINGSNVTVSTPGTSPTSYSENTSNHKTSRKVLYDVTKAPYNALHSVINNGGNVPTQDATSAIQSALNDAGNAGGGVVYLPAGYYRINTHLTIPANVELRGSSSHAIAPSSTGGTVFFLYEGENTGTPTTDSAAVTLNGNGAGISGIQFFYPNNPFASVGTVKTFPYAIRVNGVDDAYIVNIFFQNPYLGIDIANGSDRHYVKRISGVSAQGFIKVGTSTEGWIETLHDINPGYWTLVGRFGILDTWMTDISHLNDYRKLNEDLVTINGASNEHLLNFLQFAARNAVNITSGTVDAWNMGVDQGGDYSVKATGGTVNVMNSLLTLNGSAVTSGVTNSYNELYLP